MAATLAATAYLYVTIPKGFFPQQDNGTIQGSTEAAQDISYAAMVGRVHELAKVVAADPAVQTVYYWVGANPTVNSGRMVIDLKPLSQRSASATDVLSRLRKAAQRVPGIALFGQARQDVQIGARVSKTQYQYTLQDPDVGELFRWAPVVLDRLAALPELQDVTGDLQAAAPRLTLRLDRDVLGRLGITPQAVDDTLYDAFGQRQVATIFGQLDQHHVVLELEPRYQEDAGSLDRLYVRSDPGGRMVPLSALADYASSVAPLTINHQDQFPSVTLSFNLAPGHSLGDALDAIRRMEQSLAKPAALTARFQGSAKVFQTSLANQPYLIAAAIIAVYIVLGVLYESFIHPITILSTLPSAGVGAFLALMALGHDFSLIALIGVILLVGIVKKNAIMMIDFALAGERLRNLAPEVSIREACLLRFRPIMMTTMAALLGSLPLALGTGAGSELRRPLGIAIVGGLLLSQLLTLYTTPVDLHLPEPAHPPGTAAPGRRPRARRRLPPGGRGLAERGRVRLAPSRRWRTARPAHAAAAPGACPLVWSTLQCRDNPRSRDASAHALRRGAQGGGARPLRVAGRRRRAPRRRRPRDRRHAGHLGRRVRLRRLLPRPARLHPPRRRQRRQPAREQVRREPVHGAGGAARLARRQDPRAAHARRGLLPRARPDDAGLRRAHRHAVPARRRLVAWTPGILLASVATGTLIGVLFIGRSVAPPVATGVGVLLVFAGLVPLQELLVARGFGGMATGHLALASPPVLLKNALGFTLAAGSIPASTALTWCCFVLVVAGAFALAAWVFLRAQGVESWEATRAQRWRIVAALLALVLLPVVLADTDYDVPAPPPNGAPDIPGVFLRGGGSLALVDPGGEPPARCCDTLLNRDRWPAFPAGEATRQDLLLLLPVEADRPLTELDVRVAGQNGLRVEADPGALAQAVRHLEARTYPPGAGPVVDGHRLGSGWVARVPVSLTPTDPWDIGGVRYPIDVTATYRVAGDDQARTLGTRAAVEAQVWDALFRGSFRAGCWKADYR